MRSSTTRTLVRALTGAAATAATAAIALAPTAAHAAALNVTYDAVGTSTIARTGSVVALGPTNLSVALDSATGAFTGHLPIPDATSSFNAVGLLPVTATVSFIEAAPVTGRLVRTGSTTTVESTATYTIRLSNVTIAGLPGFVGGSCQTREPISIPVNTPAGQTFNITSGGPLAGSYTLGKFGNCGINQWLINLLVPGSGNTVDLAVSNGRLG